MVETKTRTVFLSTLKCRHYLTKSGAVKAEARALIEAKHPTERPEFDGNGYMTDQGWHWSMMDRSDVLLRRVCRLVRNGPNVEFSGGAPLHGAASAGTPG
jgi:hypothetical protein